MYTSDDGDLTLAMLPRQGRIADGGAFNLNPLQRLIADGMARAGFPLEQRGSQAELARRSGVSRQIVNHVFARAMYVPDPAHRVALARAVGIAPHVLEAAAAEMKGLRIYSADRSAVRLLDELHADIVLSEEELSDEDLAEIEQKIDQIQADLQRRAGRDKARDRESTKPD